MDLDINSLKIAAYLDEAGEDPATGCTTLSKQGIHYAVLRHCWADNVCNLSDTGHQRLITTIRDHNLTVICIASELGRLPVDQLSRVSDSQIGDVLNVCTYYGAPLVRIFVGLKTSDPIEAAYSWMERIAKRCEDANVTPLLEVTADSHLYNPTDVAHALAAHKRWQLLYDPVQYIMRQSQNPFVKYWTLLKQRTGAIDVRDMKIGKGFKPPGFGDSMINLTVKDAISSGYSGWFFIEPSLGRRHAGAQTKPETFLFAIQGLNIILQS